MNSGTNEKVWKRVISPHLDDMSQSTARAILKMKLSKPDLERVDRLNRLANRGTLKDDDKEQLDLYLQMGNFLTLMHCKARETLNRKSPRRKTG